MLVNFLLENQAKAIVVACNTATVSVIQKLRAQFSVPIIGIEPGVKPAALSSKSGIVGVLATAQTLKSHSFGHLAQRFSKAVSIIVQPCPGLAEQVEKSDLQGDKTYDLVKRYVMPLLNKGADTLVLGCTHYAFLTPVIKNIAGADVHIIDTHSAVAREVTRRLQAVRLLSATDKPGYYYVLD